MKTYLVGGAVRDELLDYPVKERDWVVVGAMPDELLKLGFTQVGKDFPVFLHPQTKEEHALARTERKKGHGYTGFETHYDATVTLEEDLQRRDLTINAIARDGDGSLIDPYGGSADLTNRILRHVSDAFIEDPLRVLRVARFAARYAHLGFTVAKETLELMSEIVAQGELQYLPAERIWVETERALREQDPQVFIEVLRDCGALKALLPEVDALFGIPQKATYHPEVDTGIHVLMVLKQAALLSRKKTRREHVEINSAHHTEGPESGNSQVVFAALTHDLGKGITPTDVLPGHRGHEQAGLPLVEDVCKRFKVPNAHRQLALTVCEYHLHMHRARELRGDTLLKLLEATGALRQPERFNNYLLTCEADSRGRKGMENRDYPQADYLRQARDIANAVTVAELKASSPETQSLEGKAIGDALKKERIRRLDQLRESYRSRDTALSG
ncbi:multifunctional CCA addition/repair protein [Congregibacter litoralis]|uniref:Multifunctional CCA protein n=1 Tax=Congregibacter litoralis KT71 TaxID=314285 RepID=A4A6V7_9GAMM|nr:multifunctional CCA addition/repair protein [Congregibacter litoralis]EAQ98026.1 tRNA nucleotidyltransferase/poly(A) polymerase [Congregibacter litoralis KT71]